MRLLSLITLLALGLQASAGDQACNKMCPVSGKPVDPTVKMVPFSSSKTDTAAKAAPAGTTDQMVGFCCPKCEATYDKDPAKYEAGIHKQMNEHHESK